MSKGSWVFNKQEKALYIDIENENNDDEVNKSYSFWNHLPDILLEEIFSYLTIKERYYGSLVCRSWNRAFKLPKVWSTFTLQDTTLTRGKFNYYSGWCYVLDHLRTSTCLNRVGKNFKSLIFEPMYNFHNLYEFMTMISWYSEQSSINDSSEIEGIGTQIRHLKFIFPCNMANKNDQEQIKVFGTGGKLLEALKRLTRNLTNLKSIEFIDLMLDNREALFFLDVICENFTETLKRLVLINATKLHCPLLHVGVFLNLNVLVISPQNLDEDVLELIGYTRLNHMHIFQNRYSPVNTTIQLPKNSSWVRLRENNLKLKVHLEIESSKQEIILPIEFPEHSSIPCYSIIIDNPTVQISASEIIAQAVNFHSTLTLYAFKRLPKYYQHRSFSKRLDEVFVRLCKACSNIQTLMIHDKISTGTILEIVLTAKNLKYLYIRRNAVLKRCDEALSLISNWTPEHKKWIKTNSNSYENTEKEVSKMLGYRWRMLSEQEFKKQTLFIYN